MWVCETVLRPPNPTQGSDAEAYSGLRQGQNHRCEIDTIGASPMATYKLVLRLRGQRKKGNDCE
jgi:hypothetical protein